ncbi:hypothetical protein ILYODFUR_013066, partial [Ilyodon furcidens]
WPKCKQGLPENLAPYFQHTSTPSLKEAVEPFWSPFSLMSCTEEFGNSSLDTSALSLLSASNSKPSFSGAT